MTQKLTGTIALVTGASSGIGHATAKDLAAQGATVAVVARRKDRLDDLVTEIENAGGRAYAVVADIADRAQAEQAVTDTVEKFGRLDILVNNAGFMILGAVASADPDDWDKMIAVNQRAILYVTKAALPHLQHAATEDDVRGVADIVNISSLAARISMPNQAVYNMTKFGVNGFSEALRQELASSKVRVGVLEPGVVSTELVGHNSDEVQKDIEAGFGGFRPLDPEAIADGVTYMVTRPWHTAIGELWIMPTEEA